MKKTFIAILLISSISPVFASLDYNMKYGQSGVQILELQDFLVSRGLLNVSPTGFFGLLTLNAVKSYQSQKGLPVTGYVGPMTRGFINNELSIETASSTQEEIAIGASPVETPVYYVPTYPQPTVVSQPPVVQSSNTTTMDTPIEIQYGNVLSKPDISVDGTRADVFVDGGQRGDVITITYNGVEKVTTLDNANFHGRDTMPYFNLAEDLTPNTIYDYTVKTQRGNTFAQSTGSFSTK